MKKATHYLPGLLFLFVCVITLIIACSDNSGSPQQSSIEITSISPDSGAVGSRIRISSPAIDPEHANNQIELNGIDVPILSYGSNSLEFEVPEGATSGPVTLRVNGKVASGPYFKVLTDGPQIDAISPDRGGPGTQVTIKGNHFLPPTMMAKIAGDSTGQDTTSATDDSFQTRAPEVTLKAKGQPSPMINGLPVSVSFGKELAPILSLSNTKIIVEVPDGATGGLITLTVDGQTATSSSFTLISPPVISAVTPTAGPAGTNVTISGHHFAPQPDSNRVTFNGIPAKITQADSTQLVATVPNKATTGPIKVTTRDQTATGPTFTITEAPVPQVSISNLSPKSGPVDTEVTITGQNFSADKAKNTVTFNGTKATLQSASGTELIATVPQGATSGPVKVQVNGQTATGPSFSVTADPDKQLAISDITPKEGSVGTNVTITGQNFSSTASENTVTFNGTEASISSASTTELTVSVPQGTTTGAVKVAVGSQTAEGPTFTVTEEPVPQVTIEDITPKEGSVGTNVTITGQNFSATASENVVTFNGTKATLQSATEAKLVASVPQGATDGPVKVQVNGQTATGPSFSVTADPDKQLLINNISPKEGPAGTPVTISGANFGSTASENTVTFNGTEATISKASTTELLANVPNGATSGPVTVKVGSQAATGPTFTVGDNTAPTITGEGSFDVAENTATVTTITASDPDGDALTFSLSGGADKGQFDINKNSGELIFSTAPDFENPADANADNNYEIEVKVTDSSVNVTKTITVTVMNVDEAPVLSGTSLEADENSTDAGTIAATDPEGNALTYNITGGADTQALTLDQNSGKLTFNTAPNFESPADANTDNSYEAEVTISDGNLSLTKILNITVQNVNEAPVITSATSFKIQENNTAVGTITATDPDGDALNFALLGGTKGTLTFSADARSGEITISPAPDFENPRDDNGDNTYEVDINVNDGVLGTSQQVSITVTNVVEVPTINRGVIRPATTESYSLNSTNEEYIYRFDPVPAGTDLRSMSILNFSLGTSLTADLATSATVTGGADGGLFSVNSINTYAIHINGPSSLDYNHSADGNAHEYRFTVTAENAGGTTPIYTIIIPVQNPFPQGSGTTADPYQVETIDQLQVVNQFLDAHFVQTADIDASASAGWNGGKGFEPIGSLTNTFTGSYDGGGYAITALTIDRPNTNFVGLFSRVSGTLEDIHVTGSSVSGNVKSGILAGRNDGNITNCSVSGEVSASGAQGSGGLVYSNTGTISGSYANVEVSASSSIFVGGLVGINFETISNSYATGGVSGDTYVGGLVGDNAGGSVDKSYATGMITGSGSNVGGLVGLSEGSATTTQSYWDTQSSGQSTSAGGTGLTTTEMQGAAAETNMSGFDFGTVWTVNPDEYPTLIGVGGQ